MSKNPVIPYAIIAALGFFLVIIISYVGVNHREAAEGNDNEAAVESMDAEEIFKNNCAVCHGEDLSGSDGIPDLLDVGNSLSDDEIKDVIMNGAEGMPAGLVNNEQADLITEWLLEQD